MLLLACAAAVTVDYQDEASPFDPVRAALSDALAPVQEGTALVARPLAQVPGFFRSSQDLRADVRRLEAENAALRGQLATTSELRHRVAELDGLLRASRASGLALVPTRVVAMGPAQSFTHTVTIDAGTSSGVQPDMTVLNNQGLVGRVTRARRGSATVLLLVDRDCVVGARLGSDAEVGMLSGRGTLNGDGRLDLDLIDNTQTPGKDDVVVTWGSSGGTPYVPGVPVGSVEAVFASPRDQATHAVVTPFVDFSSLDVVGVVVSEDTQGDRPIIRAGQLPEKED